MKKFAVFIIKATRKPVYIGSYEDLSMALERSEKMMCEYNILNKANLAVSGVAIQVINEEDLETAKQVEIGGFHQRMNGITPIYQFNSY